MDDFKIKPGEGDSLILSSLTDIRVKQEVIMMMLVDHISNNDPELSNKLLEVAKSDYKKIHKRVTDSMFAQFGEIDIDKIAPPKD